MVVSNKRKGSTKKNSKISFWGVFFKLAATLFLFGILFFILIVLGVLGPVPSSYQLKQINTPVASEVFSVDGKLLGRYYVENRSNVAFDEISKNVINALIATEDSRFYEHRGIDEIALLRVLIKTILLQDKSAGGGSTLSQQIAKNLFPREKLGPISLPVNKFREAIIAYRLERIYTKQEILVLYLNTVPFSENIFGIEVAAERFFSKSPANLSIPEAAVLVGMLKANNLYNPRLHPEQAKKRRNVVINQMAENKYIKLEEAEKYKAEPLQLKYRVITYNQGPAPYFTEMLKPELLEWCRNNTNAEGKPYNLFTDGLKITTTIDYNLQYYAEQSVKEYMKDLQNVFDNHWKGRDIFEEEPGIIETALRQLKSQTGQTEINLDENIHTGLFTWNGVKDAKITRLDSIKHYLKLLNTGFIAIKPGTGELKAWVGGIDFRFFKYDHVTSPRQTGSVFKPFVYLAALENGISPDKYFENRHKIYSEYKDWSPRNSNNEYGGYYTMKGALAKSINTVSVDVLLEAGISKTINVAKDLGISTDLPVYPSLALGTASISLKEITEAFAGIVNDGIPVKTNYLVEITDNAGNVLKTFNHETNTRSVVSPENCRMLIQMMEAVVENGTGHGIRSVYGVQGDFAGKTGTTQDNSDGWFIGISPDLVTGCWVGADDHRVHFRTTNYGQGAYMALPIVGKFFAKTYSDPKFRNLKYSTFNEPDPEYLAILELPDYKEILETERKQFNFAAIFSKNNDNKKSAEKKVEIDPKPQRERIWTHIKDIFKKK
ncbi:MAG: transglycosylase domain-containing protein [Bacteroidales bacterium]|jgi:penicillin-binding protein 1A|nr:transglycosylase domain-containing protein [Bacteroidales bacterium]